MDATAVSSAPPLSKAKVFLRRLITSIFLWALVIRALFFGNKVVSDGVFLLIILFLAVAGLAEFYGLAARRDLVCFKGWGMFGAVLLIGGTSLHLTGHLGIYGTPARVNDFETSFLILFVL